MSSKLVLCKSCQKDVSPSAKICPHCGQRFPGVSNKGYGTGCLVIIVIVILWVGIGMWMRPPAPVENAAMAIEIHYIDNEIYSPLVCKTKEIDKRYYVFCAHPDSKIGGLFLIDYDSSGQYEIFTINGKAAQHASSGLGLPVSRADNSFDIPKIIESF